MVKKDFYSTSPSQLPYQWTSNSHTSAEYPIEQPPADFQDTGTAQYVATTAGLDWESPGTEFTQHDLYPVLPSWPVFAYPACCPRLHDQNRSAMSSATMGGYNHQSAGLSQAESSEMPFSTYQDRFLPAVPLLADLEVNFPISNMPMIMEQPVYATTNTTNQEIALLPTSTTSKPPTDDSESAAAGRTRINAKRRSNLEVSKKTSSRVTRKPSKFKLAAIIKGDRGKQSRAESCWRCRRYKKPCNKADNDCSSCITSGFRIWPSSLGCRRGQMTEYVSLIIPSNIEILKPVQDSFLKPTSWRKTSTAFDGHFGSVSLTQLDHWDQLIDKVRRICILGPGITELLTIAANYERRSGCPNALLMVTARCLSTTIELYSLFTAVFPGETFNHNLSVTNIFLSLRQLLMSSVQRFLTSCLTGRMREWFPTFMSVNILGLVYILLGDTILVLPNHKEVWPDIKKTILQLREFHPITRDLLTVLAKGCDLLNMDWHDSQDARRLMDDDDATVRAMWELQTWRDSLMRFLRDDAWMEVPPFERDLVPVAALSRLFVQMAQDDGGNKRRRIDAG